jgi:hypothetical protein
MAPQRVRRADYTNFRTRHAKTDHVDVPGFFIETRILTALAGSHFSLRKRAESSELFLRQLAPVWTTPCAGPRGLPRRLASYLRAYFGSFQAASSSADASTRLRPPTFAA